MKVSRHLKNIRNLLLLFSCICLATIPHVFSKVGVLFRSSPSNEKQQVPTIAPQQRLSKENKNEQKFEYRWHWIYRNSSKTQWKLKMASNWIAQDEVSCAQRTKLCRVKRHFFRFFVTQKRLKHTRSKWRNRNDVIRRAQVNWSTRSILSWVQQRNTWTHVLCCAKCNLYKIRVSTATTTNNTKK